ncbi:hypothetical protein ABZ330_31235 [Streptomyces sp. NPDC006172]|uniref:hypothetical protein n=1 Tax=Streptomyces sp. NPDC006172 TaxID=3154470 RepID=UPI0033E8EB86
MTGAGAVLCAALLASCTGLPGQQDPRPQVTRQPGTGDEFDILVSRQNGYHYPPFLRESPAAPEAQSYALRALSELGRDARTDPAAARVTSMRQEALESSPLWGRAWLVPLRQGGARTALGVDDVTAVEQLRTEGGWYVDPALGDDGDAARLGATWAALEVLRSLGRRGAPKTADWLHSLTRTPRPLDESAALACALRLLDQPVPEALTAIAPPSTHDWATLTPEERAARLNDTHDHVLIQEAAGRRPVIERRSWEAVLRAGASVLSYEHLYFLVHILKAAGSPAKVFAPVIERLESERLADGTVRDSHSYVGSPETSLFVERLRALGGRPLADPGLITALDRDERTGSVGQDAVERLSRAALRRVAGKGGPASPEAERLCDAETVLPTTVTERNATRWQRIALDCADAGVRISAPRVLRWRPDTPDRAVAAATVVVGMADAGWRDRVPPWITSGRLEGWARHPESFASVYDYTLVVRAHAVLGVVPDGALHTALARGVSAYEGCPGLPGLFQVGGGDTACDLKTTWGVWALDRQLHGRVGRLVARVAGGMGRRAEVW